MKYRKEQNGDVVTIWDDAAGIGLQFKQGETLQRYTAAVVVRDAAKLSNAEDLERVNAVVDAITSEAAKQYPEEFAPLKD